MTHETIQSTKEVVFKYSEIYGLTCELIAGVITVESSGNPFAARFEPNWKYWFNARKFSNALVISEATERNLQQTSLGVMQIMGAVARERGFTGDLLRLTGVDPGIKFGCKQLAWLRDVKGYDGDDLISAYNCGTPKKDAAGRYSNQKYVDEVRKWMHLFIEDGVYDGA